MNKKGEVTFQTRLVILLSSIFVVIILRQIKVTHENVKVFLVKDDFRVFTIASEMAYRVKGNIQKDEDILEIVNSYLDKEGFVQANNKWVGKEDPWGNHYEMGVTVEEDKIGEIYFISLHKGEPRYITVTSYKDREIKTYTKGFEEAIEIGIHKGEDVGGE